MTMNPLQKLEAWLKQQVPMIEYSRLRIQELNAHRCKVVIPFERQNMNHLQCMYFGALAIGADAAAGLLAIHHIEKAGHHLNILFKDFSAKFLKRAYGDLCFTCEDEKMIIEAIQGAISENKRMNVPVKVIATPVENPEEVVAEFEMTLSMKAA